MMSEDKREHVYQGPRYRKPLLEKPPLIPTKKPLLHHPIDTSNQKKQPLLGASPEKTLLKAPWTGTKRVYGTEELVNSNMSQSYPPTVKRQALLPTPNEWGSKLDTEQAQPVSGGLLPRPYRQAAATQLGLLPPPAACSSPLNIYTPPPLTPPSVSPLENIKPPLRSTPRTPTASLSPSTGLLPLPVSRNGETCRSIESRAVLYKKAPLLQTPNEGSLYTCNSNNNNISNVNKKPLLPLVPIMPCIPQEKISKTPLLKAPPTGTVVPSRPKHDLPTVPANGSVNSVNGQRHTREPLISTPPPVLHSRFDSSANSYKKTSVGYRQSSLSPNSASMKRPLLPTPTLLC